MGKEGTEGELTTKNAPQTHFFPPHNYNATVMHCSAQQKRRKSRHMHQLDNTADHNWQTSLEFLLYS